MLYDLNNNLHPNFNAVLNRVVHLIFFFSLGTEGREDLCEEFNFSELKEVRGGAHRWS